MVSPAPHHGPATTGIVPCPLDPRHVQPGCAGTTMRDQLGATCHRRHGRACTPPDSLGSPIIAAVACAERICPLLEPCRVQADGVYSIQTPVRPRAGMAHRCGWREGRSPCPGSTTRARRRTASSAAPTAVRVRHPAAGPWLAVIRHAGQRVDADSFDTQAEASAWCEARVIEFKASGDAGGAYA